MVTFKNTLSGISSLRNERFLRAQTVLKKLVNILIKKYHVTRIIQIGSLTDKQRFGFHSDIDLCVEGLPEKLYFQALGELLLEADEFDIDIIPLEDASPKMKEQIKGGKVLYEKK